VIREDPEPRVPAVFPIEVNQEGRGRRFGRSVSASGDPGFSGGVPFGLPRSVWSKSVPHATSSNAQEVADISGRSALEMPKRGKGHGFPAAHFPGMNFS
jgi:hypothetical protein